MKIDRDSRTYRNNDNCSNIKLTPAHSFECPAMLAVLQEIGVLFLSKNFYVDSIEQIAKTVIWAHGEIAQPNALADQSNLAYCSKTKGEEKATEKDLAPQTLTPAFQWEWLSNNAMSPSSVEPETDIRNPLTESGGICLQSYAGKSSRKDQMCCGVGGLCWKSG
ncbi:hypothetical protein TNCV_4231021 [Trichonephila clavipes]|uniref:Uncharacterized protein n=1 Tax=Trichonephila clavipes TaxID=2585209 RepID=A0A8X6VKY7_TRICX|nr:hypothetical protein TNCV_4231021 [Trichonephila clavipes]